MCDDRPNEKIEQDAPEALKRALKELASSPVNIPPQLDETIRCAARTHLRQSSRIVPLPVLRWIAAAACIALIAGGIFWLSAPGPEPAFAAADLNRDGRVDVLDAFFLARQIEAGGLPQDDWDLNGDGIVDSADVGVAVAEAVRLDAGGES